MIVCKLRGYTRPFAMLIALFTGIMSQYYFTGEIFTHQIDSNTWIWSTKYTLALLLLFLAIGFATWAAYFRRTKIAESFRTPQLWIEVPKSAYKWLLVSGICYVLSILIFIVWGENVWVHWLWVAGVGFLVIPLWIQTRSKSTKHQIPTWEWISVGIISMIGFVLRYWKLTDIPSHVDNDVSLMGTYGLNLIRTGNHNWIGFSESEHLLSYDQFLAWSMRLFGQNHYGIVMVSVLLGTLSLIYIYLLGRELGGPFVGFTAIGLMTISYTHIQFSRILFGNSASFSAIIVMYAFIKGLHTRKAFWFAISGVFTGLGVLLYDSSRVIPLIILTIFIWNWIQHRQSFTTTFKNWWIMVAGAMFSFGPMLAYALLNFSEFLGRANTVGLWNQTTWQHEVASYGTSNFFQVIWIQIWRTFLTLNLVGDGSPHFGFPRPMISSVTCLLFLLGLGYVLSRLKNIRYFSILSWIFLTFILGGVLTADPPYWPHLNIALPAIFLIAAVGAASLANIIRTVFGQIGYKVYIWVLVSVVVVTGINNWQIYYDFVKDNAGDRIRISRYVSSLPPNYDVYLVSPDFTWNEYAFGFFNRGRSGQDLNPEVLVSDPPLVQSPSVFILFRHPELVPALQERYPDGVLEYHYNFEKLVSFISFSVVSYVGDEGPMRPTISSLSSPGWQLVYALVIFWVGYVAYGYYLSKETSADDDHLTKTQHSE